MVPMTTLLTRPCPYRSVPSVHAFSDKLRISTRAKFVKFSHVMASSRSPVSRRIVRHNSGGCPQGFGWSRWIGGQEISINFGGVRRHREVVKEQFKFGTRWSQEIVRSDMFTTPNSGHNSFLGKLLKFDKSGGDVDSQKTAVVDIHIRFSLSEPKRLAGAVSSLVPPWFKRLKGVQPLLHLLQNGGGGNRDNDFYSRNGYGGDDDSDESKGNRQLLVYKYWAVGVVVTALVVWAMTSYREIPQHTHFSVSQIVDCMFWLALMWCIAASFLWTARMLVSLTPSGRGYRNGSKYFRTPIQALSRGREFVLTRKFDGWMIQNVVAVPGLAISLFLLGDLVQYGKNLNLASRVQQELSRMFQLLKSPIFGGATRPASRFSRGLSTKKSRRGTSSLSKWRRP